MRIKEKKVGQHFQYRKRILDTVVVQFDKEIGTGWYCGIGFINGKCVDCYFNNHPPYKSVTTYEGKKVKDYNSCAYKYRCTRSYRTDGNNVIFKSIKNLTNN